MTHSSCRTLLFALVACLGCENVRRVDVTIAQADEPQIGRVPLGFNCVDGNNSPVITRAITERPDGGITTGSMFSISFCLVVDFIRLGGQPSCRPSQMAAWCCGQPCRPIMSHRRFINVETENLTVGGDFAAAFEAAIAGETLASDAPEEPVIIRIVGVADTPCEAAAFGEDLATDALSDKLVGCALSCPVLLSSLDTSVLLDTLSLANRCNETYLGICASLSNEPGTPFEAVCEDLAPTQ